MTGSDMPTFFAAMQRSGDAADSALARFGGSATFGGVKIATVTPCTATGSPPGFIGGELGWAHGSLSLPRSQSDQPQA